MRFEKKILSLAAALALAATLACGVSPEEAAQIKAGEYTQRFYDGDLAALHALFTAEFARELPFSQFAEIHRSVAEQLGKETEVLSETVEVKPPYHRYVRRARFERFAGVIAVNWVLREDDQAIAGVVFSPAENRSTGE